MTRSERCCFADLFALFNTTEEVFSFIWLCSKVVEYRDTTIFIIWLSTFGQNTNERLLWGKRQHIYFGAQHHFNCFMLFLSEKKKKAQGLSSCVEAQRARDSCWIEVDTIYLLVIAQAHGLLSAHLCSRIFLVDTRYLGFMLVCGCVVCTRDHTN